jgi:NADPH:quinone reductase-like Zn-dependent oxidoreductase
MTTTYRSHRVVATSYGGPEVLADEEVELSPPGPGEAVVEVRAVGTNPVDYKLYSGQFGADPSALPLPLGAELAGVVIATGPDATGPAGPVAVGDEVIAYRAAGAYADRVVVPVASLVPKPAGQPFDEAAGLMLAGTTAVHALTVTGVGAGDTVVVHGASGGVGLLAVQLAVAAGARVLATASPRRHDELAALGAEPVAYGDGLLGRLEALAPDGVDAALDLVGTDEALDTSVALVADRGRIATIAGFAHGAELGVRLLGGMPGADDGAEIRSAARLELVARVADGSLQVTVAGRHPLSAEGAAAAHRELADGHTSGKIVLVP